MFKSLTAGTFVIALLVGGAPPAAALTWTCSTVTRQYNNDPNTPPATLRSRFKEVAINASGDVAFAGRAPKNNLYLYPYSGTPVVAAGYTSAAPGGGAFSDFKFVSVNDAGDVGFHGRLTVGGEGVYVRYASSPCTQTSDCGSDQECLGGKCVVKAANSTDTSPAPGGGAFHQFPSVSRVNLAGDIAFVAKVAKDEVTQMGGLHGVFLYHALGGLVTSVAVQGDATDDGRTFCDFVSVGLGDSGAVAFEAVTKVNCADTLEVPANGIHLDNGIDPFPVTVARQGLPTPLAGTTYSRFYDAPKVNLANKVAFRARLQGEVAYVAHFLSDPVGPSTTRVVGAGDSVPPPDSGFFKTIGPGGLTDSDGIGFRAKVRGGSIRQGVFIFDGSHETVVTDDKNVPFDQFGSGVVPARYRRIDDPPGVDRSGTWAAYTARVRDVLPPRGKSGVFRCQGS